MNEMIKKQLNDLNERVESMDKVLIIAPNDFLADTIISIVKSLSKKHYGIYVSINKPHITVDKILRDNGIKTETIYFVDCITATVHKMIEKDKTERVLFASHPSDIRKGGTIPKSIDTFIKAIPDKKFILVDALRTLLIHNEPKHVSDFIHNLGRISKEFKTKVVVITRKDHDEELIEKISPVFDEVVRIK